MTKLLASAAAIGVATLMSMGSASAAPQHRTDGMRNADQIEVSSARRHHRYYRHYHRYYGPRYGYYSHRYYRPYYAYARSPYYFYEPFYGPGPYVGLGPRGFGIGFGF